MRCFVAVDLSPDVRAAVLDAQAALRTAGPRADVRWADPAQMHLTLKFLGEVADDRMPAVRAAIAGVAARHAPIALAAGGLGGFPSARRPRVLWAGITAGVRELGLLAADLERACEPLGFPLEGRPFRGHVTLGRVRSPKGLAKVVAVLETDEPRVFGAWTVREVVLYQSRLRPTGAVYVPLATEALSGPSAVEDG